MCVFFMSDGFLRCLGGGAGGGGWLSSPALCQAAVEVWQRRGELSRHSPGDVSSGVPVEVLVELIGKVLAPVHS